MLQTSIPLLRDRHSHPLLYASWIDGISLHGVTSRSEALEMIASHRPIEDEVTIVHGWLDSKFEISSSDLESFGPTAVFNLSLHGLVMNRAAIEMVESAMGDRGQWTDQFWFEKNLRRILNAFAILNGNVQRLQSFYDRLKTEQGVIYAEEMLLAGEDEIRIFRDAGLLDRTRFWSSIETYQALSQESKHLIAGMKIFADGALGVRTAAVNRLFDSGDCGMLMYSDDELAATFDTCLETGKAVAIHAIGDRAIEQVVKLIHRRRHANSFNNAIRIEHAQLISREIAELVIEANITLSMQPNFSVDSIEYADRMSNEYCVGNNPFRMLIDEVGFKPGDNLIFGSDGMPHGVAEALQQALFPPFPDRQSLTIEEFVAGYCDETVFQNDETLDVEIVQGNRVMVSFNGRPLRQHIC